MTVRFSSGSPPCDFCIEADPRPRVKPNNGSRPVWRRGRFVLMPTLGPLTDKHMLLVPQDHVTGFARLPASLRVEAMQTIRLAREYLTQNFASCVSFEHGTAIGGSGGGCGIVHAHMHLVPTHRHIEALPQITGAVWRHVGDNWMDELAATNRDASYVFLESPSGERHLAIVEELPSQFIRRWLAEQLLTEWDWRTDDPHRAFARAHLWMDGCCPEGFEVDSAAAVTVSQG